MIFARFPGHTLGAKDSVRSGGVRSVSVFQIRSFDDTVAAKCSNALVDAVAIV